jgi:hypothetical protein
MFLTIAEQLAKLELWIKTWNRSRRVVVERTLKPLMGTNRERQFSSNQSCA